MAQKQVPLEELVSPNHLQQTNPHNATPPVPPGPPTPSMRSSLTLDYTPHHPSPLLLDPSSDPSPPLLTLPEKGKERERYSLNSSLNLSTNSVTPLNIEEPPSAERYVLGDDDFPVLVIRKDDEPVLRNIMKNYSILMFLTIVTAGCCLLIGYALSRLQWKTTHVTPKVYFNTDAFTEIVVILNIFTLLLFSVFQYYVFNGKRELAEPKYMLAVAVAIAIFVGLPLGLNKIHFAYYYYLIDVMLIFVVFCGLCFMVGYFSTGEDKSLSAKYAKQNSQETKDSKDSSESRDSKDSSDSKETKSSGVDSVKMEKMDVEVRGAPFFLFMGTSKNTLTQKERIINGISFTIAEVLVSATALAYGMFLVMCYSFLSDPLKMFWRLVVHPVYFECFMMIPVRYLVQRKMRGYKEKNILFSLSVVHAQAHISSLGRMMFATLDDIGLAALSIVLLNVGKFFFRLSSPVRDTFVQRLFDVDKNKQSTRDRIDRQRYIVASAIQTEMIIENGSAIFAGFTMYFFQPNKELFTFPYPSGHLTIEKVIGICFLQVGVALIFDSATLFVAQKYLLLPMLQTWRDMWSKRYRFFGFLLYGLITMGLIGVIYMGVRVPRGVFCSTQSVCDCVWLDWMNKTTVNHAQMCNDFVQSVRLHY